MTYRGRFAPTPSGDLHRGSLLTAVASYLDARQANGAWHLRIDDIDPPREVPGAADRIQQQLAAHALHWDGSVQYQSQRHDAYAAAVDMLLASGHAFYCALSRRQLADLGGRHPGPAVAIRPASHSSPNPNTDCAIRLAVPDTPICFTDRLQGRQCLSLGEADGAFVIRRRDQLYAYQLACALDDADQGMTHILRGADLMDSTLRQVHVLDCLGRTRPDYGHLPVLTDSDGNKLSKSAGAAALSPDTAANLYGALRLLALDPPAALAGAPCAEQLAWAIPQWQPDRLNNTLTFEVTDASS